MVKPFVLLAILIKSNNCSLLNFIGKFKVFTLFKFKRLKLAPRVKLIANLGFQFDYSLKVLSTKFIKTS